MGTFSILIRPHPVFPHRRKGDEFNVAITALGFTHKARGWDSAQRRHLELFIELGQLHLACFSLC